MSTRNTITKQRNIQKQVHKADKKAPASKPKPKQAGAREYPTPPFPRQHQTKPGSEFKLKPAPMFEAPYYVGSGKLEGQVALITGGDSGIGRAVAVLFAREGADVVICHLKEHQDAKETKSYVEGEGQRCLLLSGDVSQKKFCQKAIKETMKTFKKIDILVNNAAFQVHTKNIEDLTEKHFDTTMKTNLYGYFFMARAAIPHMKKGSAIINVGSVTGILGSKNLLDYSMTKGGVHAFTRSLASNLIPRGIRVNAVAPGPVWTPLNPSDKEAKDVAHFGEQTPMKRPAQPEEMAPAFVFLASNQCSSYMTGEILCLVGGYSGH